MVLAVAKPSRSFVRPLVHPPFIREFSILKIACNAQVSGDSLAKDYCAIYISPIPYRGGVGKFSFFRGIVNFSAERPVGNPFFIVSARWLAARPVYHYAVVDYECTGQSAGNGIVLDQIHQARFSSLYRCWGVMGVSFWLDETNRFSTGALGAKGNTQAH